MMLVAGVAGCDCSIGVGGLELSSAIGLDSYESKASESRHCVAEAVKSSQQERKIGLSSLTDNVTHLDMGSVQTNEWTVAGAVNLVLRMIRVSWLWSWSLKTFDNAREERRRGWGGWRIVKT